MFCRFPSRKTICSISLLSLLCSANSGADVLALTYEGEAAKDEIRALIAPVELRKALNGQFAVQGIVDEFPVRAGQGEQTMKVQFVDLATGARSESIEINPLWFHVRNEPDTLRDLGIFFGTPGTGIGIGSRRHARLLQAAITGDPESRQSLVFKGAALRWLDGDRYSDSALHEFEAVGGTWAEFPDSNSFDQHTRDLIAILASARRYGHLAAGFERAAITMWRTWVAGLVARLSEGPTPDPATAQHLKLLLDAALQSINQALPGNVSPYDRPQDHDAGRLNIFDPVSAVDPSELAAVWIDALRATGLFSSQLPDIQNAMYGLPATAAAFCKQAGPDDHRRFDRHDLRPDMEQIAAELFEPAAQGNDEYRLQMYESLWLQIMLTTARSVTQARCEAQILLAAGWGAAAGLEQRAEELLKRMQSLAAGLVERQQKMQDLTGDARDRLEAEILDYAQWLDGTVVLAVEMQKAPRQYGVDPAAIMSARMSAFVSETDEIRKEIARRNMQPGSHEALLRWRELLTEKWRTPPAADDASNETIL